MGVVIEEGLFTDQIASIIERAGGDVSNGNVLARVLNEKTDGKLAAKSFKHSTVNGKSAQILRAPNRAEVI
jgi:hypothetical protein